MKSVLITPIGDQDPLSEKTNELGSVLTLARHLSPDRVYLLFTRHPSGEMSNKEGKRLDYEGIAQWTRESLLGGQYGAAPEDVMCLPLVVENPTDYAAVLAALEGAARPIRDELDKLAAFAPGEPISLHVSAASGTPTIKISMMLLVSSGVLARPGAAPALIYQVANPAYVAEDKRISTVDVTVVEAARLVEHSCALLQREALDAAREDVQRLATVAYSPQRRALAAALDHYVAALQLHQRLAFGAARQALTDLQGHREHSHALEPIAPVIKRQVATLGRLVAGDKREILHELLLSAERQGRRGEHADALARCWRVLEEALRERFTREHGIDMDDAENRRVLSAAQVSKLKNVLGEQEKNLVAPGSHLKENLYVGQMIQVLEALGDADIARGLGTLLEPVVQRQANRRLREVVKGDDTRVRSVLVREFNLGRAWRNEGTPSDDKITRYGDLRKWINIVRNHSVVAHGTLDVGADDTKLAVALARQVVEVVIGVPDLHHPFGEQTHQQMVRKVRAALTNA